MGVSGSKPAASAETRRRPALGCPCPSRSPPRGGVARPVVCWRSGPSEGQSETPAPCLSQREPSVLWTRFRGQTNFHICSLLLLGRGGCSPSRRGTLLGGLWPCLGEAGGQQLCVRTAEQERQVGGPDHLSAQGHVLGCFPSEVTPARETVSSAGLLRGPAQPG